MQEMISSNCAKPDFVCLVAENLCILRECWLRGTRSQPVFSSDKPVCCSICQRDTPTDDVNGFDFFDFAKIKTIYTG